ncbi:hypothetical protein, partial [Escherichia coli]|uniref:hypothetical protein n=1 Tax=Escherichia coli TaxID=562 RepID=UPI001BB03DA1
MFLSIHHRVAKISETHEQLSLFSVSIFSLIQIFKEQNFAVNLCRYTLKYFLFNHYRDGGAMRDRTADLLRAKQALS